MYSCKMLKILVYVLKEGSAIRAKHLLCARACTLHGLIYDALTEKLAGTYILAMLSIRITRLHRLSDSHLAPHVILAPAGSLRLEARCDQGQQDRHRRSLSVCMTYSSVTRSITTLCVNQHVYLLQVSFI